MNGTLPGGAPGAIALYTYEEETRDSEGNTDTDHYNFTVVLHDIPAAAVKASDVYCQRRSGFRFMDSAEDVFRRMQRLELESEALDKRYEVFYGARDDQVWMKRLFSPGVHRLADREDPRGLRLRVLGRQPLRERQGPLRQRRRAGRALPGRGRGRQTARLRGGRVTSDHGPGQI